MKNSIIKNRILKRFFIFVVWILIWHILSGIVSQELLLPSPVNVFLCFFKLCGDRFFWISIINSLWRVLTGFFLAVAVGTVLACVCCIGDTLRSFFAPALGILKSTPVASFTILALIWIKSANLSTFVAFIMVLPLIYSGVYQGIVSTDVKLLDMASVFNVGFAKKIKYIYFPCIKPFFASALSVSFGIAWKSGISAEVIGLPRNTIGMNLYNSKIYLETDGLFAWTIVIILLSAVMEKIVLMVLSRESHRGR